MPNVTIVANTSTIAPEDAGEKQVKEKRQAGITQSRNTFLVIARDATSAYSAKSGLNDYGIPFEVLIVPAGGVALPPLSTTTRVGNYGGFMILSEVSYADLNGNYTSTLTSAQWSTLYTYQRTFGARMVRLDVVPSAATGTMALGSCCDGTLEQWMAISDETQFSTAGIVVGAGLGMKGLCYYPASISNSTLAKAFALFGTTTGFTSNTVTGAINNFGGGRQQLIEKMVFFLGFAADWSTTSIILQHTWIHWATRGLFDDMFLTSPIYSDGTFRVGPADLVPHITWMAAVNAKLPTGSNWTMEVGHNGNGNIGSSNNIDLTAIPTCGNGPISYAAQPDPTAATLEYVKPPGSGTSLWPDSAAKYPYSLACVQLDPLQNWWTKPANRDGDALQAWSDNGLVNAVGDNTRPVLLNPVTEWKSIATGSGTILDLLALEQATNVRHLLSLRHDAFMFHQANRVNPSSQHTERSPDSAKSGKWSLFQMRVEVVLAELMRVVTRPVISLKHDDIAAAFAQRMARGNCNYTMTMSLDSTTQTITGFTSNSANANTCGTSILVTVPGPLKSTRQMVTEQLGGDPLTVWVDLNGAGQGFDLKTAVPW
ncbi:hypothetical protein BDZ45DRAFT_704640 [Acephala macrosclerotiorum]|nr:hypothetical protein BDZ45DRAFT_704640 [Acephala macrosclerotiorum]